jgi:hypothetical protein
MCMGGALVQNIHVSKPSEEDLQTSDVTNKVAQSHHLRSLQEFVSRDATSHGLEFGAWRPRPKAVRRQSTHQSALSNRWWLDRMSWRLELPSSFTSLARADIGPATTSNPASGASQISHRVVQFQPSESQAVIKPGARKMAPTTQQILRLRPIIVASVQRQLSLGLAVLHPRQRDQRFWPITR